MRAIKTHKGKLYENDMDEPHPEPGQVRLKTLVCGICGTDLHARHDLRHLIEGTAKAGTPIPTNPSEPVVFGHEFCGEVLEYGPGHESPIPIGANVVALPYIQSPEGFEFIGYSNRFPGALAEQVLVTEQMMFEVPNGLPPLHACLTEPVAVGAHAVARANMHEPSTIMVVGCGAIGLAVIAALKARGLGPVIACDPLAEQRKQAERIGADYAFDPNTEPTASVWAKHKAGSSGGRAVAFECVGAPGMVQRIIDEVPHKALVIGVGNAMRASSIDQIMAFNKELDIRFSMTYTLEEFGRTLHDLAEGRIDGEALIGRVVEPELVPQAFDDLESGVATGKLMVTFDD